MSETTNTGGLGNGGAYTYNSHREALYKILEATVREQAGASSSRQTSNSSGLRFPSPLLWYDEIRPADIDAYHAANDHDGIMCRGSGKVDASSLDDEHIGSREEGWDSDRSRVARDDAAIAVEGWTADGGHGLVPRTCFAQDCVAGAVAAAPVEKEVLDLKQARPCLAAPRSSKDEGLEVKSVMRPDRCTGAVLGMPSSCAKQSSHPHGRAGVQQQERERRRDADGNNCCSSQSREDICSSPAIPPSVTTTPPDPSQATQVMFLPGLPSQVLMTQPQTDTGWMHPEGHESSPREEDSALSEHAFSPSALSHNPCSSPEEQPPGQQASIEPAEGNAPSVGRGLQSSSSKGPRDERSYGSGSAAAAVERGGAATIDAALEREDARSRLNDDFARVLREQLAGGGSVCAGDSAQSTAAPNGRGRGGGGSSREQPKPSFTLVATTEVLPSGWSGGQAGAVTFLENQLLLARQRLRDGYAVRALELACHTLRQPKVCVKASEPAGGRLGLPYAAAALRQAEFAGASTPASDLPEVVGVPGFVWEILRDAGKNLKLT